MRRLGGLLAVTAASALAVTPAFGASTRAEYIAQVDPICAPAVEVGNEQLKGFPKDVTAGRWQRATRRFRVTLRAYKSMVDSLVVVQPAPADAVLIGQWLEGLREQVPMAESVLPALKSHSFKKVVKRTGRLAKKSVKTQALVAGFGFQSCDDV